MSCARQLTFFPAASATGGAKSVSNAEPCCFCHWRRTVLRPIDVHSNLRASQLQFQLVHAQKNHPQGVVLFCGGASRTRTYGLAALGQLTPSPRCFRHWRREECLQRRTVLLPPLAAHGSAPHRCAFPSQGIAGPIPTCTCTEKNHPQGVVLFCGGASRTRTYDPIDVNDVLYRLSHGTMSLDDM